MISALSPFTAAVLATLQRIPTGKVATYRQIAEWVGKPNAVRAVGNALHQNRHAPKVPCHRVVRSDGSLGGYAFGAKKKIALLVAEGVEVHGRSIDLSRFGIEA